MNQSDDKMRSREKWDNSKLIESERRRDEIEREARWIRDQKPQIQTKAMMGLNSKKTKEEEGGKWTIKTRDNEIIFIISN